MSESDLAAGVVAWLREQHWEVYQEVAMRTGGRRCDIVAKQGIAVWAIEVKKTLGLSVLEQALYWTQHALYSSVATPPTRNRFGHDVARRLGLGVLQVSHDYDGRTRILETVAPKLHRRSTGSLGRACREEHKNWAAAGNASSDFYSPWRATRQRVIDFVARNPGTTMKELVDGIDHHYQTSATARSTLARQIQDGLIEEVRVERDGRLIRLYRNEAGRTASR